MGVLFCELFTLLFSISKRTTKQLHPKQKPHKENQTPTNQPPKSAPEEHKPRRRAVSYESDLELNSSFSELHVLLLCFLIYQRMFFCLDRISHIGAIGNINPLQHS